MENKRKVTQFLAALIYNLNLKGLLDGKLFHGVTKGICVPGLNCYSCPAATGSCPLGALQSTIMTINRRVNMYVIGLIGLYSCLFGRAICGWLCPFGLLQELLYMIPTPKWKSHLKYFRWLKYVILVLFVIVIPILVMINKEIGIPAFCKYICPQGTLGGTLLIAKDRKMSEMIGIPFVIKWLIVVGIILLSIVLFRPFCRLICPLGAIYGLFNGIALVHLRFDATKCSGCGQCKDICPVRIDPVVSCNSAECFRCGKCITNCKKGALGFRILRGAGRRNR